MLNFEGSGGASSKYVDIVLTLVNAQSVVLGKLVQRRPSARNRGRPTMCKETTWWSLKVVGRWASLLGGPPCLASVEDELLPSGALQANRTAAPLPGFLLGMWTGGRVLGLLTELSG